MSTRSKPRPLISIGSFWLAVGVFLLSAWQAHSGSLAPLEEPIFRAIYNWPSWLTPLMLLITLTGSSWMVIVLSTLLFIQRKTQLALTVIVVSLTSYGLAEIIKQFVHRPRPYLLLAHVYPREWFVSGLGFPSGHTAVTTAVALTLLVYLPLHRRWLIAAWIGLVGLSRIYLGVHVPLDVIGGFCLGVIVVYTVSRWLPISLQWPKHVRAK